MCYNNYNINVFYIFKTKIKIKREKKKIINFVLNLIQFLPL